MKHKVSDAVKIRSDIEVNQFYDDLKFVKNMLKYKDKILHISKVMQACYSIVEDSDDYLWTDSMLVSVPKYQVGDIVKVRSDLKLNETYQGVTFMKYMRGYGSLQIIEVSDFKSHIIYKCSNGLWYSEIMLERISQYQIGDYIQIRSDLNNALYGDLWAINEMLSYKGTFHHITSIDRCGHYTLEGCPCYWSDEMFMKIDKPNLKVSTVSTASAIWANNCINNSTADCYKHISSPKPTKLNTYTEIKLSKPKTKKYKFYEEN